MFKKDENLFEFCLNLLSLVRRDGQCFWAVLGTVSQCVNVAQLQMYRWRLSSQSTYKNDTYLKDSVYVITHETTQIVCLALSVKGC